MDVADIEGRYPSDYQSLAKMLCEQEGPKTLIVTDHYCLKHIGFTNYANVIERVSQKNFQPENAERLMVLIDKERGALTKAAEFLRDKVIIRETTKPAGMADVLKVHDFRYVRDVMEKCAILDRKIESLEEDATPDERNLLFRYDRDSRLSVESWKAALLSCGSALEACNAVMAKQVRNAFCAVRPPGHHAGVFGKTFKGEACECDAEQTNGFCYINNVAVAASYLMSAYR